jgi:hypothetical protein
MLISMIKWIGAPHKNIKNEKDNEASDFNLELSNAFLAVCLYLYVSSL